jgi:hypothetical protein
VALRYFVQRCGLEFHDPETKEELRRLRDPDEVLKDSFSLRQGAIFIALGTLINGFSGLFG